MLCAVRMERVTGCGSAYLYESGDCILVLNEIFPVEDFKACTAGKKTGFSDGEILIRRTFAWTGAKPNTV